MRKIVFYTVLMLSTLYIVSCSTPNKNLVDEINGLESQIDSMQTVYSDVDVEFFISINKEIQQNMEYIQTHINKIDMKDTSVSKYIGAYGTLWKTLSRTFKKGGADLDSKLKNSEKQLSDLKYDVKNEILNNPEIIKRFIKSERNEVNRLKNKVKVACDQFEEHRKNYELLEPKINEIIENLKHE